MIALGESKLEAEKLLESRRNTLQGFGCKKDWSVICKETFKGKRQRFSLSILFSRKLHSFFKFLEDKEEVCNEVHKERQVALYVPRYTYITINYRTYTADGVSDIAKALKQSHGRI